MCIRDSGYDASRFSLAVFCRDERPEQIGIRDQVRIWLAGPAGGGRWWLAALAAAMAPMAQAGDPAGLATLNTFCAMLGTAASNLALTLGARGGVYIGGGIVPRLGQAFDAALFRQRFEEKGRFEAYLQAIPTWVITAATPALLGASRALDEVQA